MRTERQHRTIYEVIASIANIVWFPVIEVSSYIPATYTINDAIGGFYKGTTRNYLDGGMSYE